MRYSSERKYRKYVKEYSFLSFARKCGDKYGKKLIDTEAKTGTDAAKSFCLTSSAKNVRSYRSIDWKKYSR